MPRLTIIIPSMGSPLEFEDTLASVLQQRPCDCEVVVSRREAYDDPYELGGEVRFPVYETANSVIDLVNAAVQDAESDFVHLLMCGMEVTEGWADSALALLEDESVAAVAPAWRHERGTRMVYECGLSWSNAGGLRVVRYRRVRSRRRFVTAPQLAASFCRRSWLSAAGGLSTDVAPEYSLLAAALRNRESGGKTLVAMDSLVSGDCGGVSPTGAVQRGRSIQHLRRAVAARGGRKSSLLSRAFASCATLLRERTLRDKLAHGCGVFLGSFDRGIERRGQQWRDESIASEKTLRLDPALEDEGDSGSAETGFRRAA